MTAVADTTVANPAPARATAANTAIDRVGVPGWLQATPFALVFRVLLHHPADPRRHRQLLGLQRLRDDRRRSRLRSYTETFEGCWTQLPDLCTILKTYLSTVKFCFIVWVTTLIIGFTVAYFLAFHVRSATTQMVLFLRLHHSVLDLERHPHDLVDSAARPQRARQRRADRRPSSWTSRSNGCSIRRSRCRWPSSTSSPSSWWCRSSTR